MVEFADEPDLYDAVREYRESLDPYEEAKKEMTDAANAYTNAEKRRDEAFVALQAACPHKTLLEVPSGVTPFFGDYYASQRVCEDCGVQEQYPFSKLTGRAYPVGGSHMLSRAKNKILTGLTYEEHVPVWALQRERGIM